MGNFILWYADFYRGLTETVSTVVLVYMHGRGKQFNCTFHLTFKVFLLAEQLSSENEEVEKLQPIIPVPNVFFSLVGCLSFRLIFNSLPHFQQTSSTPNIILQCRLYKMK